MGAAKPKLQTLRQLALFRGLPAEDIRSLIAASKLRRVEHGERITLDESRGGVFVLLEGNASLLRCEGGQETFLFALKTGDFFGGPPLPSWGSSQALVLAAQSNFELLEIAWEDLIAYLRCRPELATLVLERTLNAAAEKFATLSREYSHLARQNSVPEQWLETLFPLPRTDCVRTEVKP